MENLIADLSWRGMLHDMTSGMEEHLQEGPIKGYVGFDPSADSLHLGNLVVIMLLRHLQVAGHRPVALIGGATGMVGDPSGRIKERPVLTEERLYHNQTCIQRQLEKFLDFSPGCNQAQLLNNLSWLRSCNLLQFLSDIGQHISVSYMIAKDSIKQRLEHGLSYAEFAYQMLQGYDFYYLFTEHQVTLQMGGADQWGNLTTGLELIRRKVQGKAFALTMPLLTRADGTKFGKTASGTNMWLDPQKTSPYALYQFLLNCSDAESEKLIKIFSLATKDEIASWIQDHKRHPEKRILQQELAKIVTVLVHNSQDYKQALLCSEILFGSATSTDDLSRLSNKDWQVIGTTIDCISLPKAALYNADSISALLSVITGGKIITSKSEAARLIKSRGIMVNKVLIEEPYQKPDFKLFCNRYLLVQKGKKKHYILIIQD